MDSKAKAVHRKAYICATCEAVYVDAPVTQCNCLPDEDKFIEGEITYQEFSPLITSNGDFKP